MALWAVHRHAAQNAALNSCLSPSLIVLNNIQYKKNIKY